MKPTVKAIAEEYGELRAKGKNADPLKVVQIDTDDLQDLTAFKKVHSIPTLLLVREGEILEKVIGAVPKAALLTILRNNFDTLKIEGTVNTGVVITS